MRALAPVIVAIVIAAFGQLTMKAAMNGLAVSVTSPVEAMKTILGRPLVYVGLVFYGLSSFLWLISLSRLPLSYMYPFTALLLVLVTFGSALLFSEPLNAWKFSGVAIIIAGLMVISRG